MELVIATTNLHKIRELREMLKRFPHIDVLSLHNFPQYTPPSEEGKTFKENAALKAKHAAEQLQKYVLADDSGLVIPSLGGAPGVNSRRYAGDDATDAENRAKLLAELEGKQDHERSGYFECCLAFAQPGKEVKYFLGSCEGTILREERGRNGFGYDSVFVKNDYDKTFAEIDETTKNKVSHRRKAFEKLIVYLETLTPL
jgi:XTP/dITP diphosphohydrolase